MAKREESVAERELVITRVFEAPAHLLFEAHSKREHLLKWFGPKGWPLTKCEVDFRVGGRFRFAMTGPSGTENPPFGGEYLEIERDRKIVFTNGFEFPGAEKMVITVTFDETLGKTKVTVHTLFSSVAMKNEHVNLGFAQGFGSALDQLEELVSARRRRVVAQMLVSLDGFIVAPDEDMSWVIERFDGQMADDVAEFMGNECDYFVFGRMTYEIFSAYWPRAVPYEEGDALNPAGGREDQRIIGALNERPKLVFSTTLEAPTWNNTRLLRGGLEEEIRRLKSEPGGAIATQGSASIVQALQRADLVDEYLLFVHPVLLGRGKPLFVQGSAPRQAFELASSRTYATGVVGMTYRRRRSGNA
jgi:uncharacterized protein YndB with AHSA1/START domain/dihydrofolate reductase